MTAPLPSSWLADHLDQAVEGFKAWRSRNMAATRQAFDPKLLGTPAGNDAMLNLLMGMSTGGERLDKAMPKRWAVLSAENPGGSTLDEGSNAPRRAALAQDMRHAQIAHAPTTGGYRDPKSNQWLENEKSLFLRHVDPHEAEQYALKHGQNYVLTHEGLHDVTKGTLIPSSGVRPTLPTDEAYFRHPTTGQKLTSVLDWSKEAPRAQPVEHYSPRSDLTTVDPRYMGTGMAGAEKARPGRPQMSHFYAAGTPPEPMFRTGSTKYTGSISGRMYDVDIDPLGLRAKAPSVDAFERKLQKEGFAGYRSRDVIKAFDPVPVTSQLGQARRTLEIGKQRAADLAAGIPPGAPPDLFPALNRARNP